MAKYFVIVWKKDTDEIEKWNNYRTNDVPELRPIYGDTEIVMCEVKEANCLLPLLLQPWVKSIRMLGR